jgi:hypothetical protein
MTEKEDDGERTTMRVPVWFRNRIKIKAAQEHISMMEYLVKTEKA